ncbi:filamentous hemagglutinin [Pseudomonas alcaligenes]|nr:filamentous hemagglutinin [Pseudomonas alcaligenes]
MDVRSPLFQNIATILVGVMFLNPIVSTAAELAVDAAAGGNTSIGSAGNGVPVVNIATPNANGLSHNRFTDYNVGQQGLILNNATDRLQNTQLGGYIIGNTNLNGRAAGLILNEVNGGSPSQLKGYTEVAGQGAHVIVANPHGITCDGCGFINTPKVTLSTGKPVVENGRLDRYDVDGGAIAIEGAGLNAGNVDQFELITRSAQINAELHAKQLAMVTGRNEVDAATLAATAKADDGSAKPQLAIDSSALGGMYAGAIRLVGTEQGVGVKLAGDMAASGGDIQIDANGKLTLARTAASGDIALKASDVDLTRSAYAGGKASVTGGGTVEVKESLAAAGDLSLNAARIDNQGNLEAGVHADGSANTASVLDLQGGTLTNRGKVLAQGTLTTDLAKLDNQGSQLVAAGSAQVKAQTLENQGGQLIGRQDLKVDGKQLDNSGGTLAANQALTVTVTDEVKNVGDGLILSRADGLTLTTAVLDNQGGTLQADSGELKATASTRLDNRSGKVLAGDGKLTLAAGELRNQQGRLNAQGGALTATVDSLGNGQGRIQGDSVELTSTTRLDNGQGQIVATQGDLGIKRGEVINDGGQLLAKQVVTVDADSLRNQGGTVGGDSASLTLTGKLANDGGLIEASKTLALDIGSASNAGGKLRALGSIGTSAFAIGGRFDNDGGLVEIGNAGFSLTSASLSNQQGTLRHVGTQGFALSLADAGQAGGSFITNGVLSLDVADWTNSSLLQAHRLDLKVGTFTQTASGKLVSIDDITASGGDWTNDGAIETEGKLQLVLTGRYQGNGSLKSLGDLTLSAANAELGQGAQLRSGGKGEFRLGSSLVNAGTISTVGDALLIVASLDNRGTLGAAQKLRIEAPTLLNQGLVFSGADMALRANSLTNLKGDLYSLGALSAAKDDANGQMALLENRSGGIESTGDMTLRAATLTNRKELFTPGKTLVSGSISVVCYDCSGDHHNVDYVATERFESSVLEDSAASRIHSGGHLDIQGGVIANRYSSLSATGNIGIQGSSLENTGAASGIIERVRRFNTGRVTDGTDERFRDNYINPYNAQPMPKEVPSALYSWALTSDVETRTPTGVGSPAIIQAGGNVSIQATQPITNDSVLANQAPQGGTAQNLDSQVGLTSQPLVVQLNAQLAPDANQQAVNPVTLPGFGLPQGQNGLFHVNQGAGHRYLVETRAEFANLKRFLSSDYMLNRLGFDADQAQKRLGDGLYEQRLIREAIVARTGKRFIDGLASDEAQFKYLMDNAIASKEALNLAPGVALSAEQVAALTHDIVWMQEQEVNGEKVLVPVLYLAQAKDRLAPSGALIQGQDVALISGSTLSNSGTLRASNQLQASALNIDNRGLMQAGERLSLLATDSILNARGGLINGKDVSAIALTGDIINERTISQDARSGKNFSQLTSVVDKAAGIEASNSLNLSAGRDIQNIGGSLKAGGNATLSAGNDLVIASAAEENGSMRQDKRHFWSNTSTTQHGSDVQIGGNLQASAGQDLAVIASTVKAGGNVSLEAERDITIAAAADESSSEYRYKRSGKKINKEDSTVRQQAAVIEAGGDLDVEAGGNLLLSASKLKAGDEAYLYAGEQLALTAGQDSDYHLYDMKKKGAFGAKKTQRDEVTDVRNVGTSIITGGDLTLASEGDQLYQRAHLESGGNLTLESGGAITFEAVKDMHQESHEKSKSSFVWNSMEGKGKTDETVLQSQLVAQGEIAIKAVDGLKIDIKEINQQSVSQTVDAMVAADPQLAWLKDVEQRGDVDWRRVKEIHDSFKYSHSGLGGGAAIIIAIIVAYFTAGAASGLIGSAAGATAGSGSAMAAAGTATASAVANGAAIGSTVAAGTANAALTAVASSAAGSAAVSTINNKGNLGAVVKDITSKDAMKGYVVTGVTAGLTAGLYDKWTGTNTAPSTSLPNSGAVTAAGGLGTWEGIGRFTANQMLQNGTSTLVDRALGGDAKLSDALRSSLASAFAAAGFNWVGDKTSPQEWDWKDGSLPKVGLHALMGGLAAEAAGGDFKTGALVAGLNEAVVDKLAGVYDQMDPEEKKRLLVMNSQVLGVLAAASQGGDEKSLQTGAWVAGTATQYNYLTHKEVEEKSAKERACPDQKCVTEVREQYANLDVERNKKLASVCRDNPKLCQQILDQLIKDDPKILEFSRQVAKEGHFNEAVGIGMGIRGSNQEAQSIIVRELSMLENGSDSKQFLADLAATLLDVATGGGGRTAPARGVHTPGSKDTSPASKEAAEGLEKKFGDALDKESAGNIETGVKEAAPKSPNSPRELIDAEVGTTGLPKIGSLKGEPELPPKNANPDMVRSIKRQNEAAKSLARAGYDVEQLANTGKKGANPDLRINGESADVASPRTSSVGSVLLTINDKVKKQASSVVINLADSPLTINQIGNALSVKPVEGLKKLYLMKNGEFKVIEVAK